MSSLTNLQAQWTTLYKTTLPTLAKSKDPAQPKWPVHLDHCFARIILDNAIGETKPWTAVVKSPAVKNMTAGQLTSAIELGQKIFSGEVDLVELDERSLEFRGKESKRGRKRKAVSGEIEKFEAGSETSRDPKAPKKTESKKVETISKYFLPFPKKPKTTSPINPTDAIKQEEEEEQEDQSSFSSPTTNPQNKIATSPSPTDADTNPLFLISTDKTLTPFRKKVLSLLCAVPKGNWTTYAAISAHITTTSHKTCARAVGNAMRNNPFAPLVPCHRVLASGGGIGGFGGGWGEAGKHAQEKKELLLKEGVRFDTKGRAVGEAWCEWE